MKYTHKPGLILTLLIVLILVQFGCKKKGDSNNEQPISQNKPPVTTGKSDVALWLTMPDRTVQFAKQNVGLNFSTEVNNNPTIVVDTTQTYQSIDGFGFTLTGGSASLINSLSADQQNNLLKELFTTDSTYIGISYLRISIGASDLSATAFTYDELPATVNEDPNLNYFNIDKERADLIPVLKKIIALNPSIKILACPWTAPTWMKSNGSYSGGSLKTQYYGVYAQYFVKYIQAMKAEGITIDAITPQNEPLNPTNNPAMVMQADEQNSFIKNNLGPAFRNAGINTKIICYDHNTDRIDYPIILLSDPVTSQYVDGSAFHLYVGTIDALAPLHSAFPNKNIYFTEQWTSSTGSFSGDLQWHINNLIIGATRNWSRNVIEWNLAADANTGPHTNGGCTTCQGALTISNNNTSRNVSYYIIAHASKFVRPGSVRIASTVINNLPNVAFKTPDGKKVLVVLNNSSTSQNFNIKFNNKLVSPILNAGAAATFIW